MSDSGKQPRAHPLQQIAQSPTHKLLLKQWLKEEELIARRASLREARLDGVRAEIAFLCCAFFVLHSAALVVLFGAARLAEDPAAACRRSWVPCLLSLACSMAMVWAIRYKLDVERHVEGLLEREAEDGRLLGKCVEELKRKGLEFDLLKEVDALRRAKSLRIEARGVRGAAVRKWSARDLATMFFFVASCAALGLTRYFKGNLPIHSALQDVEARMQISDRICQAYSLVIKRFYVVLFLLNFLCFSQFLQSDHFKDLIEVSVTPT